MTLPPLPVRTPDSHKGTYGRALVIAGSRGMTGAATMTALAALRTGAGLVTVATPASCVPTIAAFHPSYMTIGLDETSRGELAISAWDAIAERAKGMTCVAIGPGLGTADETQQLIQQAHQRIELPMVIDADGITAVAAAENPPTATAPRVFTPHVGEFRLLARQSDLTRPQAVDLAPGVAMRWRSTLVLKGDGTLITDGDRSHSNGTGNAGMATAGSGDVLTGVILGLLAQGMPAFESAALGAYLHGFAGDLAAEGLGMHSLIATDIIDYLPSALMEYDDPTGME